MQFPIMWKISEVYNLNNKGPKTLLWDLPEATLTDTLVLPSKRTRCLLSIRSSDTMDKNFPPGSNTYRPQLIQQTAVTNPIKCNWEVQLNKLSLHAPVQSNLQMVRQCEQSITCTQVPPIRKLRRRKQTVTLEKWFSSPATIFSNKGSKRDRCIVSNIRRRFLWHRDNVS